MKPSSLICDYRALDFQRLETLAAAASRSAASWRRSASAKAAGQHPTLSERDHGVKAADHASGRFRDRSCRSLFSAFGQVKSPSWLRSVGHLTDDLGGIATIMIFPDVNPIGVAVRCQPIQVPHLVRRRREPIGSSVDAAVQFLGLVQRRPFAVRARQKSLFQGQPLPSACWRHAPCRSTRSLSSSASTYSCKAPTIAASSVPAVSSLRKSARQPSLSCSLG